MGLRDRLLGRESKITSSSSSSAQKAPPIPNASKPQIPNRINAVYYPNWRVYRQQPPSSMNLAHITHIFYAFAWVKPDGTVYLSDPHADTSIPIARTNSTGCLADLLALRQQHPHLHSILSIGGGGTQGSGAFASATSSPATLTNFATTAKQLCSTHNFDGVDIDWEYPCTALEGKQYLALLSILRQPRYFPRDEQEEGGGRGGWFLTSALAAAEWGVRHIDLGAIAGSGGLLDWINLMSYDFAGPWMETAGYHAQLWTTPRPPHDADDAVVSASSSVERGVEVLVGRGVESGKVVVGVPCYGRVFRGAKGPGDGFGKVGEEEGGVVEYRYLMERGVEVRWDPEVGAAWCVDGDGWISFDDVRCVKAKGEFVREKGLGGLFFWTGTGDVEDGDSEGSLVRAGAVAMRG